MSSIKSARIEVEVALTSTSLNISEMKLEEVKCLAQSPDFNITKHLRDEAPNISSALSVELSPHSHSNYMLIPMVWNEMFNKHIGLC